MTREEMAAIIDPEAMEEDNIVLAGGWDRQAYALRRADAILSAQAAERGLDAGVVEELRWIEMFAHMRSQDDAKTFAKVARGALRTIHERAAALLAAVQGGDLQKMQTSQGGRND